MSRKSVVGDLINFRGLVCAPVNENGVIFLFGKVADDLNMYIEEIKPGFPDCIARRFVGKGWERITIEFEYLSSHFKQHGHEKNDCDVIVCWDHDWADCPIEVVELKTEIRNLENYPVQRPGSTEKSERDHEKELDKLLESKGSQPKVREWYHLLFQTVSSQNDAIWAKVGKKYLGWYSPERAFASILPTKQAIQIECFSRGKPIPGTVVSNRKYAPRWVRLSVKSEADVGNAKKVLLESLRRMQSAIKAGETTGYFSGGQPFEKPGGAEASAETNGGG